MPAPYYHYTTHYSDLAQLGFNEMLFTHAGLSYTLISSLYLDQAGSGLTLHNKCRYICLNYNQDANRTIAIRYLPYSSYIKVRNPIRLSSKAKLRSTIKIRRYAVSFAQTISPEQSRVTYYQPSTEYNFNPRDVVNDSTYEVANNGDLVSSVTLSDPPQQNIRTGYTLLLEEDREQVSIQRIVTHLPSERGYIYEVGADLRDIGASESFNNQRISASKILLPGLLDGHIPASRVGHDMNVKSPADIAWALIYAVGAERPIYVLDCLKGLISEAQRRQVIIKDPEGKEYIVNPEAAWGFESNFVPSAASVDSSRDIGDNALLGWALCVAVRYLQQRVPLDDWSLTGSYSDFKPLLKQLLLAQGYLCAYAVSRQTWWCCARAEGLAYNYAVLSQRASYLTSIFLDELLQISYDHFIHQQAARLYISITSVQEGVFGSEFFSDFNDGSNSAAAYKGFWLWAREQELETAYNYLLDNYVEDADDTLNTLVVYVLTILHNKLNATEPLPNWLIANKGNSQQAAQGIYLHPTKSARQFLPVYLAIHNIDATNPTQFRLKAREAFAQVTFTLTELRRIWPRGYRWGSSEIINSVNTVLGSMLQADANLYFDYFLLKDLTVDARSLTNSQGAFVRDWFRQLLGMQEDVVLAGDDLFRKLTVDYVNRDSNDRESVVSLLTDTLGYPEASLEIPQPKPYSLIKDVRRADDTFTDYQAEVTELGQVEYFNKQKSHSIVYKPAQERLVSEGITTVSSIGRITEYGGRLLRRVPGFPYRNVPVSYAYPNASLDVPINQEYSDTSTTVRLMYEPWADISNGGLNASYEEWTNDDLYAIDGAALIKPLKEYVPRLIIKLGRTPDKHVGRLILETVAAGVKLEIAGLNPSRPYLNTFYVFAESTYDWRIDNINRFNNEDYDDYGLF